MLGFYNYTVVLTYIGMLTSFVGISFIFKENIKMAIICLMVSGLCDMFDGKIASTKIRTVQEKRFGIQIDSLSDLICFGMLPALLVYYMSEKTVWNMIVSGAYVLCALIRLAYFNVDEEERQNSTEEGRTQYQGLPVTTVALVMPMLFYLCDQIRISGEICYTAALALIGIGFITPFKLKKPGILGKIVFIVFGVFEFFMIVVG